MTSRAALLFDLDGTLVDSDARHLAAFQRVFAPHGIVVDQTTYERDIHGASNEAIGRVFLSHLTPEQRRAVLDDKEAAYRSDLVDIAPIAGAVALIDFAGRRGMKRAVVTNGPRANAEKVLAALGLELRLPIVVDRVGAAAVQTRPAALPEGPGANGRPRGALDRIRGFPLGRSRGRGGGSCRRRAHDDSRRRCADPRGRDDSRRTISPIRAFSR